MNSIGLKRKELLRSNAGCYGNQVTRAMRYVTDAYGASIANMDSIRLKAKQLQSKMYFPIILII